MLNHRTIIVACAIALSASLVGAQTAPSPTCFTGSPPGTRCSGYVLLEGTASRPVISTKHTIVTGGVAFPAISNVVEDLPEHIGGGLGYVRVVSPTHAVGGVAELEFANGEYGNGHRVALTLRDRHWFDQLVFDAGAGPVGIQVPVVDKNGSCCDGRVIAYGGTAEVALTYRGWIGLMAGVDAVHGGGRSSMALKVGARSGSYGSIVSAVVAGVGALVVWRALAGSN